MAASQRFPETLASSRPRARVVAAWLAVSVAVHAALLLAMPGLGDRPPVPPELTVTIHRAEPPRRPPPERPRERPPEPRVRPQSSTPRANTAREPEPAPPRPILALPQQAPPQEPPAYTVPAPSPVPEPPREAAAKPARQPDAGPSPKPAPRMSDAYPIDTPVRYPRTAERGRVTLTVLISREGRVADARLEKSSGFANLDRNALQEVRRWRFQPALQGAEAVEQTRTIHVDYP